jgi:hypothetical protein
MQQELVDQYHRQQARPGKATRDRMRGRRRLGDRLAIPAGELFADMLDNLPTPRLAFQGFRDDLAKLVQQQRSAEAGRRELPDDLHAMARRIALKVIKRKNATSKIKDQARALEHEQDPSVTKANASDKCYLKLLERTQILDDEDKTLYMQLHDAVFDDV